MQPYHARRKELLIENDCLLWGTRVLVPEKLQPVISVELHRGHPGVVRIRAHARSRMWWPSIDKHIKDMAKTCTDCQDTHHAPPNAPLHPWAWPEHPWQRLHADFAGPVASKMLWVVVDAHSKWPEVVIMPSTTSSRMIIALRDMFARWGLPEQLVTEKGPQFCRGIPKVP